jgi:mannan endo-1,4-beta-mannosidase
LTLSFNTFNDEALQTVDYAIYKAGRSLILDLLIDFLGLLGLKLILPLTDNYHYYHGGKYNFTNWRGLNDENMFYTDELVIQVELLRPFPCCSIDRILRST